MNKGVDALEAELLEERDKNERMYETLRDFADHGTRHDTEPTCIGVDGPPRTGWYGYIKEMDEYVREKAAAALVGNPARDCSEWVSIEAAAAELDEHMHGYACCWAAARALALAVHDDSCIECHNKDMRARCPRRQRILQRTQLGLEEV